MKALLAVIFISFLQQSFSQSVRCQKSMQNAARCALGPMMGCFQRNGCVFPDKIPGGGGSIRQGGNCSCIADLIDRASPVMTNCMRDEFPNLPDKFYKLMRHTMESMPRGMCPGQVRTEMRRRMNQSIRESCASSRNPNAVRNVKRCLGRQQKDGRREIMKCLGNIPQACKNQVLDSMCNCVTQLIEVEDPNIIQDGLDCAQRSGIIDRMTQSSNENVRNLARNMNAKQVRFLVDRVCNSGNGLKIIREIMKLVFQNGPPSGMTASQGNNG